MKCRESGIITSCGFRCGCVNFYLACLLWVHRWVKMKKDLGVCLIWLIWSQGRLNIAVMDWWCLTSYCRGSCGWRSGKLICIFRMALRNTPPTQTCMRGLKWNMPVRCLQWHLRSGFASAECWWSSTKIDNFVMLDRGFETLDMKNFSLILMNLRRSG